MTARQREQAKQRMRRWRLANREHVKAYAQRWAKAHRDMCRRQSQRMRAKHGEKYMAQKRRRYHEIRSDPARATVERERRARVRLLSRYGLSGEQFDALLAAQHGGCALCSTTFGTKATPTLCVDHDHRTGRVRGLLCHSCNAALGLFREDAALIWRAFDYLTQHSTREVSA